jgi:hypothetical protein
LSHVTGVKRRKRRLKQPIRSLLVVYRSPTLK